MSSPTQGTGGSGDKPPGFSRFMRRASKVLRRSSSKRQSSSEVPEETPAVTSSSAAEPIPEQTISDTKESAKSPALQETPASAPSVPAAIQQSIRDIKPSTRPANARLARTAADSSAIQEEKARILFAKYGLTLAPGEWTPPIKADAERVEKKIRMRVHRTCHRCQTTFGPDKTCNNCKHTRCKKCPRYPAKSKDGKKKDMAIAIDEKPIMLPLVMRSRVTGKDMERRAPVQRVRRTCHLCNTLFLGSITECSKCNHLRCSKCPRDPPKLNKYPDGYPGDVDKPELFPMAMRDRKKVRVHVKWTCHTCEASFKDRDKTCSGCGHERCEQCPRYPRKKEEKEFDEDVVRRVEEKLKGLNLSPQASAA